MILYSRHNEPLLIYTIRSNLSLLGLFLQWGHTCDLAPRCKHQSPEHCFAERSLVNLDGRERVLLLLYYRDPALGIVRNLTALSCSDKWCNVFQIQVNKWWFCNILRDTWRIRYFLDWEMTSLREREVALELVTSRGFPLDEVLHWPAAQRTGEGAGEWASGNDRKAV